MDVVDTLKTSTLAATSVALWLVGINPKINLSAQGISLGLASVSSLFLLTHTQRLAKTADLEHGVKELQKELILEDLALNHIAQQEALRRSYLPDPWEPAPAVEHRQPRQPRHIPPDVEAAVEVDAERMPEQKPDAIATLPASTLTPFDFSTLTHPDGCPCVAIVGNPGSGKSVLTTWLITTYFPGSKVSVYDTDCQPGEWQGLTVVGRRGNHDAIGDAMLDDLDLLRKRTQLRGEGKPVGGEEVRVVEEFPTLAADLDPGDRRLTNPATEWLRRMVRRGRKYRFKLFLVSQSWSVKGLRIEGEGDLRTAFTMIFLGSYAFEAIKTYEPNVQRREAIRAWLQQQTRPAVVIHQGHLSPAEIPNFAPQQTRPIADNPSDFWDPKNHVQKPEHGLNIWRQHPETLNLSEHEVERLNTLFNLSPSYSEHPEHCSEHRVQGGVEGDANILNMIVRLKQQGLGKIKIIKAIWGVDRGGSNAYKQAEQTYNRLTGEN